MIYRPSEPNFSFGRVWYLLVSNSKNFSSYPKTKGKKCLKPNLMSKGSFDIIGFITFDILLVPDIIEACQLSFTWTIIRDKTVLLH